MIFGKNSNGHTTSVSGLRCCPPRHSALSCASSRHSLMRRCDTGDSSHPNGPYKITGPIHHTILPQFPGSGSVRLGKAISSRGASSSLDRGGGSRETWWRSSNVSDCQRAFQATWRSWPTYSNSGTPERPDSQTSAKDTDILCFSSSSRMFTACQIRFSRSFSGSATSG